LKINYKFVNTKNLYFLFWYIILQLVIEQRYKVAANICQIGLKFRAKVLSVQNCFVYCKEREGGSFLKECFEEKWV
jgi:hypothetical protein